MGKSLDVNLLESSFALLAPRADELVSSFYSELFRRHPQVKPMFANSDLAEQRKKLIGALQLVMANIRKPENLVGPLRQLGARHTGFGAEPAHYGAVAAVLIDTMKSMAGRKWTAQIEDAWKHALSVIADLMLQGAAGSKAKSTARVA